MPPRRGEIWCPTCHGKRKDPYSRNQCCTCDGAGVITKVKLGILRQVQYEIEQKLRQQESLQ